ncbi:MAG: hypothetical protein ACFFB3_01840 [Candidatus Hodarchaeota archaeon]
MADIDNSREHATLIDESEVVAAVRDFIDSNPWTGTEFQKLAKFDDLLAKLCDISRVEPITYYVPPKVNGWQTGLENTVASLDRSKMQIIARKYSLVSCLWGFHQLTLDASSQESSIWASKVYCLADPDRYQANMEKGIVRPLDIENLLREFKETMRIDTTTT